MMGNTYSRVGEGRAVQQYGGRVAGVWPTVWGSVAGVWPTVWHRVWRRRAAHNMAQSVEKEGCPQYGT